MPELPEVETVRAGLAGHTVGHLITGVEVYAPRSIRRQLGGAEELAARVTGRLITGACRRGKYLWLRLSSDGEEEDYALLIHLGMSGQVLIREGNLDEHRHLRVRFTLERPGAAGERQMWFVDQRMFGYVAAIDLIPDPHAAGYVPETMAHIGPDLLEPVIAPGSAGRKLLNRRIRRSTRGIKTILLDQELVSGIGNIYANEALWRTRLHYARPASALSAAHVNGVLDAASDVLEEALAAGGTSFDELYVNVAGEQGYFERSLAVYGRSGEPCNRCGAPIVREKFMNRSSHFCPDCQRER